MEEENKIKMEEEVQSNINNMEKEKKQSFANYAKYLSILFSATILMCGLSVAALGLHVEIVRQDYKAIKTYSVGPTATVITLGLSIFALSIVGLVGIYRHRRRTMKVFLCMAVFVILLEMASGILCFIYSQVSANELTASFQIDVSSYKTNGSEELSDTIDKMQSEFRCCGADNFLDWSSHPKFQCTSGSIIEPCYVPVSCCAGQDDAAPCKYYPTNEVQYAYRGNAFAAGCRFAFKRWVIQKIDMIGIASLAVIVPQVVGAVVLRWFVQDADLKAVLYTMKV